LGSEEFDLVGHSMGAFVAQQVANLAPERVLRLILIDALGKPEPSSLGPIAGAMERLGAVYPDRDTFVTMVRDAGVVAPWSPEWERIYNEELEDVEGGVRLRADRDAIIEDATYGAAQEPAPLWNGLTMPTLVVRAAKPMLPGLGFIVSAEDRDAFVADHPKAHAVDIDASHYIVGVHEDTMSAIARFLDE
jgi:pimeloyl-ACP methyl ester carboxylesterase